MLLLIAAWLLNLCDTSQDPVGHTKLFVQQKVFEVNNTQRDQEKTV